MTSGLPSPQTPAPRPQLIGFDCRVCGTRLYGKPDQVGKRFKCPDCGALTVLRPPATPKPKKAPAALEGEQYEVWGPDEQPSPSELAALQPKYIAVVCRVCSTLMHATEDQVGRELVCPDCRARNIVPPPAKRKHAKSELDSEDDYQIDASRDPGERPPVILPQAHTLLYEEVEEAERAAAATNEKKQSERRRTDARGRPVMPRFPLLTGVVSFLFYAGTRVRWLVLSAWLLIDGMLIAGTVSSLSTLRPAATGISPDAMKAIAGVCFLTIGGLIAMLWSAATSSILATIVTESSEGNDRIEQWPPVNVVEWLVDLVYVVVAVLVSAFPGWLITQFILLQAQQELLWVGGSMLICFPIIYLSQQAASSPWAMLSGQVIAGLLRRPFSWLLFYIESALLAAACVALVALTAPLHHLVPVLFAPVYVAAGLLYGRLLGRLGWRIAAPGGKEKAAPSEQRKSGEPLARG